jgi:hypothetical protein
MAPASSKSSTTVALYGLVKFLRIPEAQVVLKSVVQMLSLTAMSCPSIGEIGIPRKKESMSGVRSH